MRIVTKYTPSATISINILLQIVLEAMDMSAVSRLLSRFVLIMSLSCLFSMSFISYIERFSDLDLPCCHGRKSP